MEGDLEQPLGKPAELAALKTESLLGTGAFCTVYKVRFEGQTVALKRLKPDLPFVSKKKLPVPTCPQAKNRKKKWGTPSVRSPDSATRISQRERSRRGVKRASRRAAATLESRCSARQDVLDCGRGA